MRNILRGEERKDWTGESSLSTSEMERHAFAQYARVNDETIHFFHSADFPPSSTPDYEKPLIDLPSLIPRHFQSLSLSLSLRYEIKCNQLECCTEFIIGRIRMETKLRIFEII